MPASGYVTSVSTAHVTPVPVPAGSGSLRLTPFAVPVPVFLTSTVKPTWSPAFTEAASAVFVITTFAGGYFTKERAAPPSVVA